MTFAAMFLIVIISSGLIIQKIRSGINSERIRRYREEAQDAVTMYLLTDIPGVEPYGQRAKYEKELEPLVRQLALSSLPDTMFGRSLRRRVLSDVMLEISQQLFGETQVRLTVAFQALGFVDEEIRSAQSRRWWIRARACHNLGMMQAQNGVEILSKNLDDPSEDVRIEAAQSLIDIVGVDVLSSILLTIKEMSKWMQVRLSKSILGFGGNALPHLVKGLSSRHYSVQKFCIEMFGRLGDVYAVPTLIEYMNYGIPELQMASVEAFGRIGDERAIPVVLKFAKSENEQMRTVAAAALGNLGSPATIAALNQMLLHDTIEVRLAAAEALTKVGDAGIRTLKYAIRSDDEKAKLVAMQFLHEQNIAAGSGKE